MNIKNVEDVYPLSPAQEAVLLRPDFASAPRAFCVRWQCGLRRPLDAAAFERAWQQVVERHAALRTFFVWERLERPLQVVSRQAKVSLETHDWSALAREEREGRAGELFERGLAPSEPPLLRLALCRVGEDRHLLAGIYHRLALDEGGLSLVLDEVLAACGGGGVVRATQGETAPAYWDYVKWAGRQDASAGEAFWRDSLAGAPPPTLTGFGRAAGAEDGRGGFGVERVELSAADTEALGETARRLGVSPRTLVPACWALLLSRYGGREEVLFGVELSARAESPDANLEAFAATVGTFTQTLPLRVGVPQGRALGPWLADVEARLREARRHAHAAPSRVAEWLDAADGGRHFESVVGAEQPCARAGDLCRGGGLEASRLRFFGRTDAALDIGVVRDAPLTLEFVYDRRRFDADAVSRMAGHVRVVLEALAARPELRVADLPLLSEAEERQLLVEWNDTATEYPRDRAVHELFEEQAARRPEAVAVVFGDGRLGYGELNRRANQLARHLRQLGVGLETRVALCLERSAEMLVAILGVLKAGGAYVPLDPAYPLERLAFMLEDSQAPVVLTTEPLLGQLPGHWGQVICLDSDWEAIASQEGSDVGGGAGSDSLAYVMYTSGSTGTPKGVEVTHRAVVRLVKETDYARFDDGQVFLQYAPTSFDASTFEIWGALLNGGRLVVMPAGPASLEDVGRAVREHGVTTLWLTAGLFHLMVDNRPEDLKPLSQLLAGGDVLSPRHVRKVARELASCRLINGYGPTEGTTFSCTYAATDPEGFLDSVPIGRPIANTRVYILDGSMRPVPVGLPGDLYVAGDGLARGYQHRPALTAERFIPDPFSTEPGGRLYRTGDLARYRRDGQVEFLGRADQQVKVRGHRIELGEVEAALAAHPSVAEVAVAAREDVPGDKILVAYLVWKQGAAAPLAEVRDLLKGRLPEQMHPSAFVTLEALPLTANGKVDRAALPAPDHARPDLEEAYAAPRTPEEEVLASILSQVLGVERVGIDDNFFALGGDSIRAVQVLAKAQERGLSLTLQELFEHQTVRLLAARASVAAAVGGAEASEPFGLVAAADRARMGEDVEDAYPLTMLQTGMVFHTEYHPGSAVYHDIFSHHLRAPYDPEAFRASVARLQSRHPVLRTSFHLTGFSEPLQLVHREAPVRIEERDLRHLAHDAQEDLLAGLIEGEKRRGFEWTRPPLINFYLHRRSDESWQFTFGFHHAILDGWSVASMLTELFLFYLSALGEGRAEPGPAPAGSYRDYVAAERAALQSEEARRYWERQLEGLEVPQLPRLPAARVGGAEGSGVLKLQVPVTAEESEALKGLARTLSIPTKSVLLAAHLKVLSLLGGRREVLTGLVSNGRPEEADGERILGLFLNTMPLRLSLRRGTWADLAQQAFAAEWEGLPHRWYPLAQIQLGRGTQTLLETSFNFTHFHVIQTLQRLDAIQVLGSRGFERTNFPLAANFNLDLLTSDIQLSLSFDLAHFSEEHAKEIAGYYSRALKRMAAEPLARHDASSLLGEEERRRLLVELNQTEADYGHARTLPELFEAQAARTPGAAAVRWDGGELSYAELNRQADRLARRLRAQGLGPEALVGVLMERAPETVAALLGVLKAGAAYVPLDPSYPAERLAYMIEDSGAALLLTQRRLAGRLPRQGAPVWCVDEIPGDGSVEAGGSLPAGASPETLAYVIYTSGSTGRPKGVMITHRGLCNYLQWCVRAYDVAGGNGAPLHSSLSFDLTVTSLYAPLLVGRAVHLLPAENETEPLARALGVRQDYSLVKLTPAHLPLLREQLRNEELSLCSRVMVIGGENLLSAQTEFWRERVPGLRIVNEYGPTETVVGSSVYELNGDEADGSVPIGRPVANTRLYVLDGDLNPVPAGVAGELYIGGAGVARGYLGRPGLTAEKFVPDAFCGDAGARLYRTGDLARRLPGGDLEFLGRADQQVKLRGYRVEPGEIESALCAHAAVREAAVVADGEGQDRRLVAYVVGQGVGAEAGELQEHLRGRLPEYMVPSAFVTLERLPLTPNGKLDRRALPAPGRGPGARAAEYVAPRTPVEETVARVWAESLGLERVGVHDNFFDLGGHSLAAVVIMSRLRAALGMDIPLKVFFSGSPTVEQLAEVLTQFQLAQADEGELLDALGDLGELSDEEVRALLAEEQVRAEANPESA